MTKIASANDLPLFANSGRSRLPLSPRKHVRFYENVMGRLGDEMNVSVGLKLVEECGQLVALFCEFRRVLAAERFEVLALPGDGG